jgi:hypothetical protein
MPTVLPFVLHVSYMISLNLLGEVLPGSSRSYMQRMVERLGARVYACLTLTSGNRIPPLADPLSFLLSSCCKLLVLSRMNETTSRMMTVMKQYRALQIQK